VKEETGVSIDKDRLTLIGVYSNPDRDPRGHSVSVAYTVRFNRSAEPQAGSDAESAEWITDWKKHTLAFNHAEILTDAEKAGTGRSGYR
jgi:8-oxo-dGTP diphosphatase